MRQKISILCPPEIKIPPNGYAGIERIAYDLFKTMLKQGYDVTIFGNPVKESDREKRIFLDSFIDSDLIIDFTHQKYFAPFFDKTKYMAIVFHTDNVSYVNDVYSSNAVRNAYKHLSDGPVIYPGLDENKYIFSENKEDYLLFLGKFSYIKRPDIAIQVARETNTKLILAGHAGIWAKYPNPQYVEKILNEAKNDSNITLILDPDDETKAKLLSKAKALIVPSDWSVIKSFESFGLVAVEALLSGTPVITSGDGGLKEIVQHGINGYICSSISDYKKAYALLDKIDPKICRRTGEKFTSSRYAKDLLEYHEEVQHTYINN